MQNVNWILIAFLQLFSWGAALHALFYKRDSRSALGWIVVCLMFPLFGPLFYFLLGINRVRTHAQRLQSRWPFSVNFSTSNEAETAQPGTDADIPLEYRSVFRISEAVAQRSMVRGNALKIYHNGEQAYPAMLEAINQASDSLYLSSYIFDTDKTGTTFIRALSDAVKRGVDVKVILDGIGELYSFPWAGSLLKKQNIPVARFLPPRIVPLNLSINLRNHRKILVADGRVAFTGGMNISDRHMVESPGKHKPVVDIHFRLLGPVAVHMRDAFLEDWSFCSKKTPAVPKIVPEYKGDSACRLIVDGPNSSLNKLDMILVGAISTADKKICIMTPYFVPSRELIGALKSAALRGVDVNIILPFKNNLPYVKWATENMLWELLERGVKFFYQPPPFVHSKLFLIDEHYAQIGSANIDARSLRLNFELVVEVYDKAFAKDLADHFFSVRDNSTPITLQQVDSRSFAVHLRDSLCWLFSPYL